MVTQVPDKLTRGPLCPPWPLLPLWPLCPLYPLWPLWPLCPPWSLCPLWPLSPLCTLYPCGNLTETNVKQGNTSINKVAMSHKNAMPVSVPSNTKRKYTS